MTKSRRMDSLADIPLEGPDTPTVTRPPRRATGVVVFALVVLFLASAAAGAILLSPDALVSMVRAFSGR